jgi:hypothetical protein
MSNQERLFTVLLRSYPRAYRECRGEEILDTLLEASRSRRGRGKVRDALDIVGHGLRLRFGLTSDRFAGQVLASAALPGLLMASAVAAALFISGNWFVLLHASLVHHWVQPWMAPGLLFMVWALAGLAALVFPSLQRWFALLCVLSTLATVALLTPLGFGVRSPTPVFLVLFLPLALPSWLAPGDARPRYARSLGALAGLLTFGLLGALAGSLLPSTWRGWVNLYVGLSLRSSGYMPYVAGIGTVAIVGLMVWHKRTAAGAVALLLAPWLVLASLPGTFYFPAYGGFAQPHGETIGGIVCLGLLSLLVVGMLIPWSADRRAFSDDWRNRQRG